MNQRNRFQSEWKAIALSYGVEYPLSLFDESVGMLVHLHSLGMQKSQFLLDFLAITAYSLK